MIRNKTSILPRLLSRLMAVATCVQNPLLEEKLINYCEQIGLAFQLKDDLLNLEENELSKGKQMVGEDIYQGKKTLIVIQAAKILKQAKKKETLTRLMKILKSKTEDEKEIKWAIEVMREIGAIESVKKKGETIVEEAWRELSSIDGIPMLWKLKSIGEYLIDREL